MKKSILTTLSLCLALITTISAQKKDKFLDTLSLGIRYQVQEFHTLNQKLLENCNCDESLRLNERALQGISASLYKPLSKLWSLGADLGGTYGTVMDDNRNYKKYSFGQMRIESFFHLLGPKMKLRPYLSASVHLIANPKQAFFSLPLGAGFRYQLMRGGNLHIQTAYDRGISPKLAKNMITNVGFHVPLYKRRESNEKKGSALYVANQTEKRPASTSSSSTPGQSSAELLASQSLKPELVRFVYFDTDKHSLNKLETTKVLKEVNAFVKQYPDVQIYLKGHTDSVLDDDYNMALSKRRVQAVFNWLKNQGIAAERISTEFFGKSEPATSNDNAFGRAANRRVVILVK
jgi:outer membrane protein OmpA-like peptidoglycan-associated protein